MNLLELLDREYLGNSVLAWATCLGAFVLAWVVLLAVRSVVGRRLGAVAGAGAPTAVRVAQHALARTTSLFLLLLAAVFASRFVVLRPGIESIVVSAATIGLMLQVGLWTTTALTTFIALRRERQLAEDPGAVAALDLLGFVLRLVIWAAVLLVMLDNVGVNVTTLVAGLGVGGIAVALAAQNILGDLFASLSIVLDKPFVVGDFLIVGEFMGSVENVGLKTTRIRSLSGEQVVFSNKDLLDSRIRNYGRMFERRVVFSVDAVYETPLEKLKAIPAMIRSAIESHDRVRFDRAHFSKFGESALSFEAVYYVLSPDFNLYMDIQQSINLALVEGFAREHIEFAYPTRTIRVLPSAAPAS